VSTAACIAVRIWRIALLGDVEEVQRRLARRHIQIFAGLAVEVEDVPTRRFTSTTLAAK